MRYAIYRCLYGEDFVQDSINSVTNHVDKIFVFWTNKVWGGINECVYKGESVQFPDKFDSIVDKIKALNNPKIELIEAYTHTPRNQLTFFVNTILLPRYPKPDFMIFPEVDHVFCEDQISGAIQEFHTHGYQTAKMKQVELWKTPKYRIPERPARVGVVLWNFRNLSELPTTGSQSEIFGPMPTLNYHVHNFGFAASEKVMFWKHMTALGFSKVIGDSPPNEMWYDKWCSWRLDHNNENLEISLGCESNIPYALPYDTRCLPKSIRDRYNL